MKQSGFLERQNQIRKMYVESAERVTQQLMLDTLQVTLHEEFGWGYDRIKRLTDEWGSCYNHFHGATEIKRNVEADYLQEVLDRKLKDILKDHQELLKFEERYPEIKKITYGK